MSTNNKTKSVKKGLIGLTLALVLGMGVVVATPAPTHAVPGWICDVWPGVCKYSYRGGRGGW